MLTIVKGPTITLYSRRSLTTVQDINVLTGVACKIEKQLLLMLTTPLHKSTGFVTNTTTLVFAPIDLRLHDRSMVTSRIIKDWGQTSAREILYCWQVKTKAIKDGWKKVALIDQRRGYLAMRSRARRVGNNQRNMGRFLIEKILKPQPVLTQLKAMISRQQD